MTIGSTNVVDILVNWFPMLLLIVVWILFLRRMQKGIYTKYQKDYLEAVSRQTEILERIAAALERNAA